MSVKKQYLYYNDFTTGISIGHYEGVRHIHKFGHNADVGATFETLWGEGGIYAYPATELTMQVSSSDIDDTSAGAGAQTVRIEGVDKDCLEINETVSLNGQTQVPTTLKYMRVFRIKVMSAGASGWNEGTIYIGTGTPTAGKPSTVYGLVEPFMNQSLMAMYTLPASYRGVIVQTLVTSAVAKVVEAGIFVSVDGQPFQIKQYVSLISGEVRLPLKGSDLLQGSVVDIEMRARAGAGGGNISGQFGINLLSK